MLQRCVRILCILPMAALLAAAAVVVLSTLHLLAAAAAVQLLLVPLLLAPLAAVIAAVRLLPRRQPSCFGPTLLPSLLAQAGLCDAARPLSPHATAVPGGSADKASERQACLLWSCLQRLLATVWVPPCLLSFLRTHLLHPTRPQVGAPSSRQPFASSPSSWCWLWCSIVPLLQATPVSCLPGMPFSLMHAARRSCVCDMLRVHGLHEARSEAWASRTCRVLSTPANATPPASAASAAAAMLSDPTEETVERVEAGESIQPCCTAVQGCMAHLQANARPPAATCRALATAHRLPAGAQANWLHLPSAPSLHVAGTVATLGHHICSPSLLPATPTGTLPAAPLRFGQPRTLIGRRLLKASHVEIEVHAGVLHASTLSCLHLMLL